MTTSVVRDAQLEIRIPKALDEASVREVVESRFLPAVVEALAQAVRKECGPEAILAVQELNFFHSVDREELFCNTTARAYGQELWASLRNRVLRVTSPRVVGSEEIAPYGVVFANSMVRRGAWFLTSVLSPRDASSFPFVGYGDVYAEGWLDAAPRTEIQPVLACIGEKAETETIAFMLSHLDERHALRVRSLLRGQEDATDCTVSAPLSVETSRKAGKEVALPNPDITNEVVKPESTDTTQPEKRSDSSRESLTGGNLARSFEVSSEKGHHNTEETAEENDLSHHTFAGGLVYLVKPILELNMAEHLWCAGADEVAILRQTLQTLVPVPLHQDGIFSSLLGDCSRSLPKPLPQWAVDEVRQKCAQSARDHLLRYTGVNVLASKIEEDCTRRQKSSVHATGLTAYLAAILRFIFMRRVGEDEPVDLETVLLICGGISQDDEATRVHLPMNKIDIAIRRAGLDQNPGYVPWLSRRVEIVFGDE